MSSATNSQGVTIKRGNSVSGASSSYTLIAEILSFSGPNETAKQIEVTSLDSTAKEYIGGLVDGGEVSFEMNFLGGNAQQQGIRSDMVGRLKRDWTVILNDAVTTVPTSFTFTAVVTAFSMKGSVDNPVTASVTLKMTGAPTIVYCS